MLKSLEKLANRLDQLGEFELAAEVDSIIKQVIQVKTAAGNKTYQLFEDISDHYGPDSPQANLAGYMVGGYPEHKGKGYKRLKTLVKLFEEGHDIKKAPTKPEEMVIVDDMWLYWDEFDKLLAHTGRRLLEQIKNDPTRQELNKEKEMEARIRQKYMSPAQPEPEPVVVEESLGETDEEQ
jgi:hypothetical protein